VESVNSLALILTPILAGFLYDRNPSLVFRVGAVVLLFSLTLTLWTRGPGRRAAEALLTRSGR
jgi:hypothetical protein